MEKNKRKKADEKLSFYLPQFYLPQTNFPNSLVLNLKGHSESVKLRF